MLDLYMSYKHRMKGAEVRGVEAHIHDQLKQKKFANNVSN